MSMHFGGRSFRGKDCTRYDASGEVNDDKGEKTGDDLKMVMPK
jgi:hypothetical protein